MKFYYYNVKFRLRRSKEIKEILNKVIRKYRYMPGDLKFIITNNKIIKELNRKFLGHNYTTDVISFKFNDGKIINGEIYISIEQVKENAKKYKETFNNELMRVIIHGTLHLADLMI